MITIFIRTVILFLLTVLVIRVMGKRQLAQLQPYEVVITLMIAELAAIPMGDVSISLFSGVVSVLTLLFVHSMITLVTFKSQRVRGFICGKPSVLIRSGKLQVQELERLCFDLNDLLESMRTQGILSIADVGSAILETNGTLNVFPSSSARPATTAELGIESGYEGIPLILILDSVVQDEALSIAGLDRTWLSQKLKALSISSEKRVLLASLDTEGRLFVQEQGERGKLHVISVLKPEEVVW